MSASSSCPHPGSCPLFRVYSAAREYDEWNPGKGGSRFAPFQDAAGSWVPTLYLAESGEAALLGTVFHDVVGQPDPVVYEVDLLGVLLVFVRPPRQLNLLDLRDPELARVSVDRSELVTTSAEIMVVFGDRYPVARGGWPLLHPGVRPLVEGEGCELVDRVANRCDATMVTDP